MSTILQRLIFLLAIAGYTGAATFAQVSPESAKPDSEQAPASPQVNDQKNVIEDVGVDIILVPDKEGRLHRVPNLKLEDLIQARRLLQGLRNATPPRFTLAKLELSGKTSPTQAELLCIVTLNLHSDQWVRIPLGLSRTVLREPVSHRGGGQLFMEFDEKRDGFVCWLKAKSGGEHQITLKTIAPLFKVGGETSLRLTIARAARSEFSMEVMTPRAVGRVSAGSELVSTKVTGQQTTRFIGLGVGSDFELAWHPADQPTARLPTALEATGAIQVQIDGRSIRSQARLNVRSFGGAFDQFSVRLPPGAEIVVANQPGYTIAPVDQLGEDAGRPAAAKVVEVKLNRRVRSTEILLVTDQSRELASGSGPVELAGFEVVDAVRQWGHLALEVADNWQVLWGTPKHMRQVEDLPEVLRRPEVTAGFEYFSQPCSLSARVIPRATHVRVEPEYVLQVGAREIALSARLKYHIRGAKSFSFDVKLPGWEIDDVGPENVVNKDEIVVSDKDVLTIPLLTASTEPVELIIQARKKIPPGVDSITADLPVPSTTSRTPSSVVIVPDDNVKLTPQEAKLGGLVRQQIAPPIELPLRQQEPLYYRGEGGPAQFATKIEVQSQAISVAISSQVYLSDSEARVDQRLEYNVLHEPLDRLLLEVPRGIAELESTQIQVEGQEISLSAITEGVSREADSDMVLMRASLPQAKIGRFTMQLRYPVPLPKFQPQQSIPVVVPLVISAEGELSSNEVIVNTDPGIEVVPRGEAWTVITEAGTDEPDHVLRLESAQPASQLPLSCNLAETRTPQKTVIDRAWIQSWLTSSERQDRACYRIVTSQKELEVIMPVGVELESVEVKLDGKILPTSTQQENTLVVKMPRQSTVSQRHLELRYQFTQRTQGTGQLTLQTPRWKDVRENYNVFWNLVLPTDEHVATGPAGMTPWYHWGWQGFYWGRHPLLQQSELEAWVGATPGVQVPRTTNQYLFGSLSTPESVQLQTVGRTHIVLLTSFVALTVGLLLIYVPQIRKPGILFVVFLVILAVGIRYPAPVMLIAQAATLGIGLSLFAALLKYLLARRPGRVLVEERGSSLISNERISTETFRASVPEAHSSAATTIGLTTPGPPA